MGLFYRKVPTVNPSVKNQRFLPAPFGKGAFGVQRRSPPCPRLAGFHIGLYFQEVPTVNPSVTATPCQLPLAREPFCTRYRFIVRYRTFSIFQSTAWDKNVPKFYKSKTGAKAETPHPSQSEGSIPVGSSRGILKGGTIRAGASCSPLKPDNFPYFLAGARKYGPAGKRLQKADWRTDSKVMTG